MVSKKEGSGKKDKQMKEGGDGDMKRKILAASMLAAGLMLCLPGCGVKEKVGELVGKAVETAENIKESIEAEDGGEEKKEGSDKKGWWKPKKKWEIPEYLLESQIHPDVAYFLGYNADGTKMFEIGIGEDSQMEYIYLDFQKNYSGRACHIYVYDQLVIWDLFTYEDGRALQLDRYRKEDEQFSPDAREIYIYEESDEEIFRSKKSEGWSGSGDDVVFNMEDNGKWKLERNSFGKIIKREYLDENWQMEIYDKYIYDQYGILTKEIVYDAEENKEITTHERIYQYDANGCPEYGVFKNLRDGELCETSEAKMRCIKTSQLQDNELVGWWKGKDEEDMEGDLFFGFSANGYYCSGYMEDDIPMEMGVIGWYEVQGDKIILGEDLTEEGLPDRNGRIQEEDLSMFSGNGAIKRMD